MGLSTGYNKIRTAVFISGTGSNLNSLIKFSKTNKSPISIEFVVSSNSKAKGLNYAKINDIKKKVLNFKNKNLSEKNLLSILKVNNIEMICLAGFMKILSRNFIRNFKGKIINIHPSLLPKFKGLDTFKRVLKSNEKFTGCTVHFVDEKLDNGKIILKKRISIKKNFDEKRLKHIVQVEEYKAYSEAIRKIYISS